MELLTAAQMRAIEQAAIDSGEVTGLELMERAGRGVVEAVLEEWPAMATAPQRAVVLCGPGNNGGDGFVVARLLKQRGWDVEVYLYGDAEKLPPDAAENYRRWCEMGEVGEGEGDWFDRLFFRKRIPFVMFDALFGTGFSRPLDERFDGVIEEWGSILDPGISNGAKVVAIDTPTGFCLDSGKPIGRALGADLTVAFHKLKLGHVLDGADYYHGKVKCVDIGLKTLRGREAQIATSKIARCLDRSSFYPTLEERLSKSGRRGGNHKFSHGHAFILSGGVGKGGAARLAARGALRVGAGVVTVGAPPSAIMENAIQLNAIMLKRVDDAKALMEILKDERINAVCLGPGFGLGKGTRAAVAVALVSNRGVVLDADALSAFEERPKGLFDLTMGKKSVLTPHMGEFGRLFPDIKAKLDEPPVQGPAYSKVDAAREAAVRAGCVVLMKGPDTVIASPDGRASIAAAVYERACPWLATAGAGDVLAGIITGLLARGFGAHEAAATGAWLHQEAARAFGPGLIAEDLPEMLPKVFRDLGV